MRVKGVSILVLLWIVIWGQAALPQSSDPLSEEREVLRKVVLDELGKRRGAYSSPQEDADNWKFIQDDKTREDEAYRENVDKARLSFVRAQSVRDDLVAQARSLSTDAEDTFQQIKTIRTTLENIEASLVRWDLDMKTFRKSFATSLEAEKQGSALVAVLYTANASQLQSAFEPLVDRASVSILDQHRGAYLQSFVKTLDNTLPEDVIRNLTNGAFVGGGEKPLQIELAKDARGVTYLRLKHYDFYPFQRHKDGQLQRQDDPSALPAAVVNSLQDLDAFLKRAGHSLGGKEASTADGFIRDAAKDRIQAEERLNEQVRSFREKIAGMEKRIIDSRADLETWNAALKKQEFRSEPIRQEQERTRLKIEAAERSFREARSVLQQRIGLEVTLIPVRDAAFLKGGQTAMEAAAQAIVDKLAEVKTDARRQYDRYTREAVQALMKDQKKELPETDARVTGAKILSFIAEGDMVRIKAALRVQVAPKEETPPERKEVLTDPIKAIELVLVKGGCFQMGDGFGDGKEDEKPVHTVCVDDYYIGKYEITQGQWQSVMGSNPSFFKNCGEKCPVEQVNWNDIQAFIGKLNAKTGKKYRLPTEAEWEYAARSGGKNQKYSGTSSDAELDKYAWYSANAGGGVHPSGEKQPNGLGLYDMTGNVWEWCQDWYGEKYYSQAPRRNPSGPATGIRRVLRGGAWIFEPAGIRTTARYGLIPVSRSDLYGFRLALPVSR